jgi:hypothetical protein
MTEVMVNICKHNIHPASIDWVYDWVNTMGLPLWVKMMGHFLGLDRFTIPSLEEPVFFADRYTMVHSFGAMVK